MVVIKDGKTYYTRREVEKRLDTYIEKTADELILELRQKRLSNNEISAKQISYV